jgi:hypothetical protein
MQLVCQPNSLNRRSFSQQEIDELSEILTVQKNEGCWLPILPQKRRASGMSEVLRMDYFPLVGGAGSHCIQSSSQRMIDLALVALHHGDFATARERIELLTLLRIKHIVDPPLRRELALISCLRSRASLAASLWAAPSFSLFRLF